MISLQRTRRLRSNRIRQILWAGKWADKWLKVIEMTWRCPCKWSGKCPGTAPATRLPGDGIPGTGRGSLSLCPGPPGGISPGTPLPIPGHGEFHPALGMPWECLGNALGWGGFAAGMVFPPNPWIPLPRDVNRVRLSQTPHSHLHPSLEIPGTEIQAGRGGINMGWSGLRSETPAEPRDEGNRAGGIPSTSRDRAGSCLNPLRAGRGAGSGGRRC